jgi:hypothetical protein
MNDKINFTVEEKIDTKTNKTHYFVTYGTKAFSFDSVAEVYAFQNGVAAAQSAINFFVQNVPSCIQKITVDRSTQSANLIAS